MSKLGDMAASIAELRNAATAINGVADRLVEAFSAKEMAEEAPVTERMLTLEEVRAVLAEKSRKGHTAEIRSLLLKYGADKLSQLDPVNYRALLADAEVLKDAT